MRVVAISAWQPETPDQVQGLAGALGVSSYEARQRMIGKGPAVVASFKETEPARALEQELRRLGFSTVTVDADASESTRVRRFRFREEALLVETKTGHLAEILYDRVELLLPVTRIAETTETRTFTERKLSIGKTLATGGVPMFSKVEHQEKHTTEERGRDLYLHVAGRAPVVFGQNELSYDGFGEEMKLSRELNFAHLIEELRRFCPAAVFDDRLLNRMAQVRLLGPTLPPESHLELAAEILARSLLAGKPAAV